MPLQVQQLALGSGMLSVNAYLISGDAGFVLIDTGMRRHRALLDSKLAEAGCIPGSLNLVLITHGDADHIGNARHVRDTYDSPVAMHASDVEMAAEGNMFAGRKAPNPVVKALLGLAAGVREEDRFSPDVLLDESSDLTDYGLPGARILLLQGHSAGSIALVLEDGSLLCGDVMENRTSPKLGSIMDDVPLAQQSVQRLLTLDIGTVYPGHGRPFQISEYPRETAERSPV